MYYPYVRGKQFELIALRDCAEIMANANFIPIIEPVRDNLSGLLRALNVICEAGGQSVVVVNPQHGDLSDDGNPISELLDTSFQELDGIRAGILLIDSTTLDEAMQLFADHEDHEPCFIHSGFRFARNLADQLADELDGTTHVFLERYCKTRYRSHFRNSTRILLRDGFEKRKNADYPNQEIFSELHLTYEDEGMDGFGDFLIVGDEYSEGGGPAYAVAIHLSFINSDDEEMMYMYHFISDQNDTPTDPAGKFFQALTKLITAYRAGTSQLHDSTAMAEFETLYNDGHFPGLGQVKKLSLNHHIETLADYLA